MPVGGILALKELWGIVVYPQFQARNTGHFRIANMSIKTQLFKNLKPEKAPVCPVLIAQCLTSFY
jgi:hypothetical protein